MFDCNDNAFATTTTDANGNYLFDNLTPGCYVVQFEKPVGYEFTTINSSSDIALDSDAISSGSTVQITLGSNQNDLT